MVQRGHVYAIVDEVDSILIDEARTPLIISGPLDDRSDFYNTIDAYHPAPRQGRLRGRREAAHGEPDRSRHGEDGAAAARRRSAQGRLALRHRERLDRPPRQPGPARAQAVPARQGLHRAQRRGRDHRRIHRPHDAGPPLFGRSAPGAGGQGAPADPAGKPDAGLDHVPELFPHVRQARRHDRHRADRSGRVLRHLQSRRWSRCRPTVRWSATTRTTRSIAPTPRNTARSSRCSRNASSAASRFWSAPPRSRNPSSLPRCCGRPAGSSTTSPTRTPLPRSIPATRAPRSPRSSPSSTRAITSRRPISSRRPACRARSPSPPTWPAAAPTFSSAAMPTCASARNSPDVTDRGRATTTPRRPRSASRWRA